MPDRDCLRCRFFGPRRRVAGRSTRADTDRRRAFGHHPADRAATHRHQSAAALSSLRQLVRSAISAERDGAVSGKTLLVAAGLTNASKRIPDAAQPGFAAHYHSARKTRVNALMV